jgi:hypothetical protein
VALLATINPATGGIVIIMLDGGRFTKRTVLKRAVEFRWEMTGVSTLAIDIRGHAGSSTAELGTEKLEHLRLNGNGT